MEFARAVLASIHILGPVAVIRASECVAQLGGGIYFGLIHKNIGWHSPPRRRPETWTYSFGIIYPAGERIVTIARWQ